MRNMSSRSLSLPVAWHSDFLVCSSGIVAGCTSAGYLFDCGLLLVCSAYKTEELEKQAADAITQHNLIFIEEVVSFMDCSRSTFYERRLDKSDILKGLILRNKNEIKARLRKKWYEFFTAED